MGVKIHLFCSLYTEKNLLEFLRIISIIDFKNSKIFCETFEFSCRKIQAIYVKIDFKKLCILSHEKNMYFKIKIFEFSRLKYD